MINKFVRRNRSPRLDLVSSEDIRTEGRLFSHKRAEKLIKLRQYKQLINDCDLLITEKKQTASTYYYRGLARAYLKQYSEALENLTKAIELNPQYAKAYKTRGKVYAIVRKNHLALDDFNQAIELNSQDNNVYFYRALSHHAEGNYELALADYNHTLMLVPLNKRALINRQLVMKVLAEKNKQQN